MLAAVLNVLMFFVDTSNGLEVVSLIAKIHTLCQICARCSDRQSEYAIRLPLSFLKGSVFTSHVPKTETWQIMAAVN